MTLHHVVELAVGGAGAIVKVVLALVMAPFRRRRERPRPLTGPEREAEERRSDSGRRRSPRRAHALPNPSPILTS